VTLTCQTARLIVSDYINGDLDAEAGKLLETHLQTCTNCPPLYAALITVRRDLRRLPRASMPSLARERLHRHLGDTTHLRSPPGDAG